MAVLSIGQQGQFDIAIYHLLDFALYVMMQSCMLRNAASQDNPLRRIGVDEIHNSHRKISRFQVPGGMGGAQVFGRFSPSLGHGGPGGQAFQAIAMVGTNSWEWIPLPVVWDVEMPGFGMHQAMDWQTIGNHPDTNPGAYRDIQKWIEGLVFRTQCRSSKAAALTSVSRATGTKFDTILKHLAHFQDISYSTDYGTRKEGGRISAGSRFAALVKYLFT